MQQLLFPLYFSAFSTGCDVPRNVVLFCCLCVKKRARVGIRKARPAANPAGKKCRSTAFFSVRERAPTGAPKRALQDAFEKHAARLFFLCHFPFQRVLRAEIGEPFYILLLCKVDILLCHGRAARWMLIKILSAVIHHHGRVKIVVSGGCHPNNIIIRKYAKSA